MRKRRFRKRTTGCTKKHDGSYCRDCSRIRVQRFRKKDREQPLPRLPLTEAQRLANRAGSFVRKYLQRGAIAPPDGCERCELDKQVAPSRELPKLYPWHPDPAQPKLVAWLCARCRRRLRASGESITVTWQWPGLTAARSRKAVPLPRLLTAALAAVEAKLPAGASSSLRDAALLATLVAALAPGQRERLYAAGALGGPHWRPTADSRFNTLLRRWVFDERAERTRDARAAGGTAITPLPAAPRRARRGASPLHPPPSSASEPMDPQATWAELHLALEHLAAAEAEAEATNARVAAALRRRL
jgi:hypothetical protein